MKGKGQIKNENFSHEAYAGTGPGEEDELGAI